MNVLAAAAIYVEAAGMSKAEVAHALIGAIRLCASEGRDIRPKVLPLLAKLYPREAGLYGISPEIIDQAYEDLRRARAVGDVDAESASLDALRALQEIEAARIESQFRAVLPLEPGRGDRALELAQQVLGERGSASS